MDAAPWTGTPVGDMLPVEGIPSTTSTYTFEHGVMKIVDADNEFMASLPWDTLIPTMNSFRGSNRLILKPGAHLLAVLNYIYLDESDNPFLATWLIGEGQTFAMGASWREGLIFPGRTGEFWDWEYYPDFVSNIPLYVAGVRIPTDYRGRHVYKTRFAEYWERRSILMATLEFVEKFGTRTSPLIPEINANDDRRKMAEALYIEQDFQGAIELLDDVHTRLNELGQESLKLMEQTMFWIWVIEYLTVTATIFTSSYIIWTLMVRHRLYKEVGLTRGIQDS